PARAIIGAGFPDRTARDLSAVRMAVGDGRGAASTRVGAPGSTVRQDIALTADCAATCVDGAAPRSGGSGAAPRFVAADSAPAGHLETDGRATGGAACRAASGAADQATRTNSRDGTRDAAAAASRARVAVGHTHHAAVNGGPSSAARARTAARAAGTAGNAAGGSLRARVVLPASRRLRQRAGALPRAARTERRERGGPQQPGPALSGPRADRRCGEAVSAGDRDRPEVREGAQQPGRRPAA